MGNEMIENYRKITEGVNWQKYVGPEEQGKAIKTCTILKRVEIRYSNSSSFSEAEENTEIDNYR